MKKNIEKIKSSLKLSIKFAISKIGITFYFLFLLAQLPLAISWGKILSLFLFDLIFDIKVFDTELLFTIIYLIVLMSVIFFILNLVLIGALINSILSFQRREKVSITSSIKTASKKFRKLVLVGFLVVILNFLSMTSNIVYLFSMNKNINNVDKLEKFNVQLNYVILILDSLSMFGKPIIQIPENLIDLCIINDPYCLSSLISNAFMLSTIFLILIKFIFIFILQEIMLTEQNLIFTIKKSLKYLKENFVEISLVWSFSVLIFLFVIIIISSIGYLSPLLIYYIADVLAFLLVLAFQTSYYINFVIKQK
ncbi:MAG: hypothetical protein QXL09_00225 [Candidatus Aenigmatarchaeota archaeon]